MSNYPNIILVWTILSVENNFVHVLMLSQINEICLKSSSILQIFLIVNFLSWVKQYNFYKLETTNYIKVKTSLVIVTVQITT